MKKAPQLPETPLVIELVAGGGFEPTTLGEKRIPTISGEDSSWDLVAGVGTSIDSQLI